MERLFRASLAELPEVRTSGSFAHEQKRLEWVQPPDLWQGLLYRHEGTFYHNGYALRVGPFDLVIVPPGSRCAVDCRGDDTFVYDYFGFRPVSVDSDVVGLPLLSRLGSGGSFWDSEFRKSLNKLQFSRTHVRWLVGTLLWSVSQPAARLTRNIYVEHAELLIEQRISEHLRVSAVARELSISQSQLSRLFVLEHGRTPMQYIRDRRAQLANALLTTTTEPIKSVASKCGFPDVHRFNRFVRDRLGASPRAVRKGNVIVDVYRVEEYRSRDQALLSPTGRS